MARLLWDTWDSDYGSSSEEASEEGFTEAVIDLVAEVDEWGERGSGVHRGKLPACGFVDGVRRVEARLFLEDGDLVTPALIGGWGVGVCSCDGRATIPVANFGKMLVTGHGRAHADLCLGPQLVYETQSASATDRAGLDMVLHQRMRLEEARVAEEWMQGHPEGLLFLDGPLQTDRVEGAVVGCIKRQIKEYLEGEEKRLLSRLRCGYRTPVFTITYPHRARYSWYVKLAETTPMRSPQTGLMRCEVSTLMGIDEAVRLADLSASILPCFASEPHADARAPQNLYPVMGLERDLKHRMGDVEILRRLVMEHLLG